MGFESVASGMKAACDVSFITMHGIPDILIYGTGGLDTVCLQQTSNVKMTIMRKVIYQYYNQPVRLDGLV